MTKLAQQLNSDFLANLIIKHIHSAATIYTTKGKKARKSNRSYWSIICKYEGETIYNSNGKKYLSNYENIIILPYGCSYEWICTKSGHFSFIEFQCDFVYDEIISIPIKNTEKILSLFKKVEYTRTLKKSMYEIESIKDTYSIILKLAESLQHKYSPLSKQQKLLPAIEYIAKNYDKPITNEILAEVTGISTVYFRRLFTEIYNISPIAYVNEIRIKKAKEMLRSDYGTITDIALSLGYSNIYDFSRNFKKHTGIPPSQYH